MICPSKSILYLENLTPLLAPSGFSAGLPVFRANSEARYIEYPQRHLQAIGPVDTFLDAFPATGIHVAAALKFPH